MTLAKLRGTPIKVTNTFEAVLERFIASQKRKGRRSADETRRILEKDALPYWRGRAIEIITPADIVERVEAIVDRGKPVAASRFRAWCSKLFSYAVQSQFGRTIRRKALRIPRRLGAFGGTGVSTMKSSYTCGAPHRSLDIRSARLCSSLF